MVQRGEGLRDRRRRETRRGIHLVVLRLAREHGLEKVTVEMIGAEAGISPRTFFNYFPGKEAAAVELSPAELSPELVEDFVAGPSGPPREVLADLSRLLLDQLGEDPPDRDEANEVFALARAVPGVTGALMARIENSTRRLADAAALRMGPDVDPQLPVLIASMAMAAVRTGMENWARSTDAGDSPVPHVERAVALLRTVLS